MKAPDPKAEPDADPPDFDALTPPEELVRGDRTRDDFFDAVLRLSEPSTVDEVADLADHGPDAAREYLDWFERMGIVHRVGSSPATYRLNRDYLTWRRVQRVRTEYTETELVERLDRATERERSFAAEFGVDDPSAIRLSERAVDTERTVEDVWATLTDWRTTRRRISILERALSEERHSGQYHGVA